MAATFLSAVPQPGDGAYLMQRGIGKRRSRKKLKSLLRQDPDEAWNEPRPYDTFLRPAYEIRKGRSTNAPAPDHDVSWQPRTIESETSLSSPPILVTENPATSTQTLSSPTLLRGSVDQAHKLESTTDFALIQESSDAMTLPPHLRAKKVQSSSQPTSDDKQATAAHPSPGSQIANGGTDSRPQTSNSKTSPLDAKPSNVSNVDIREKLRSDYGVKFCNAKPVTPLVSYSSSNEGAKPLVNHSAKVESWTPKQAKASTHNHRLEGRGPRASRWPTAADTRADPHRWDMKWNTEEQKSVSDWTIDSVRADSGHGEADKNKKRTKGDIDADTGFKLTDWDGNWAPPPVDWDARPAFRNTQSAKLIEDWLTTINEELCGKSWGIPTDQMTILDVGEAAPRYWVPVVIGRQAPQTFWNELVKSKDPEPVDEEDLNGVRPWWEQYQSKDATYHVLRLREQPQISGIDPDENSDERLARENDHGSNDHAENRIRTERAKRDAQRDRRKRANEKIRKISKSSAAPLPVETIKPGLNLYLRSARPADIQRIREIYNYYVSYSVCTPETKSRTNADMLQRYRDVIANKLPFLVACERGGKIKPCRKKFGGEDIILPDKIVGFAVADDYNDMQGMYRFTAEVEVYTDNEHYMKGVAKCLLDKLMAMLDPEYVERGGYDIVGEELEGVGPSRIIQNIVINLPYEKQEHLAWKGRFMSEWLSFKQVGNLEGIGIKDGKSVNLAIFQRTTGAKFDPAHPPIMMEYPS